MSLFGAMNTAVSGLNAQSSAFGNISDNVANSQTIGFKRIDTRFTDYLTTSTRAINESGSVVARPDYVNNVQGTIQQTDNALGLAIAGGGFFTTQRRVGTATGETTFDPQPRYTRAGDFQKDADGYLVNGSGDFLTGWEINKDGAVDRTKMVPIQVNQARYAPVQTSKLQLSANLPANPASATEPVSSQIQVYDALGTPHTIKLDWTQSKSVATPTAPSTTITDSWDVAISQVGSDGSSTSLGAATVVFGPRSGNANIPNGTIGSIRDTDGVTTVSNYPNPDSAGATLHLNANFGHGGQNIALDLGDFGKSTGLTQYDGSSFSLHGLTQDGVAPGKFSSVTTKANGDVVVNYDNGQSRSIARVPITTFPDPNRLQRQDGQAFTATSDAGIPLTQDPGSNGAGNLVTSSIEQSNVDIAKEFTKLIVAQRAYSANTKMVTTADELLQQTLDMKR